ncbi:MAG: SPOR domain-containing protein [Ignavibacteriae bacterium]|nr:SPOR domain-containing protein [Ignavibacteriota bacterium]
MLVLLACKSTETTGRSEENNQALKDFLDRYEKTFNPSDYDSDFDLMKEIEQTLSSDTVVPSIETPIVSETVQGFRVQALFTQDIDQANQVKDSISKQLPDEWVYIVYDAPYYKVRVGNFLVRSDANPMVKKLVSLGYRDAWIVPDIVIKHPPRPTRSESTIEPEKKPDQ